MAITPLPPAPEPSDTQAQFNTKAFALVAALDQFVTETNATALAVDADAATATAQAGIATTKAAESSGSAAEALAQASGTVATGSAKDWATKTSAEVVAGQGFGAKKYADDAALSAAAAAASALEAAGLVESYQGALAADPALDKEGNPLAAGDWYINTVSGFVRAYNGTAWVQGISVVAGVSSLNGLVGDLTGFVTETGAQSLSNKTLIDPIITLGGTNGTAGQVPVSQGAGLPPVWEAVIAKVIRVERTSNTALTAANSGNLIDITSGTFTQTFDACSSLGNGWFCYIRNSGTGDITLDPNASETIDGLTSYIMYPGEVRLVQCDGTALRSVVLNGFYKTFTTSGTFTKPPGYAGFDVQVFGGGGSGAAVVAADAFYASGGGGGGWRRALLNAADVSSSEMVTVGAGGSSVTVSPSTSTNSAAGNPGGNSAFGGHLSVGGGGGGIATGTLGAGASGGTSPASTFLFTNPGGNGGSISSINDPGPGGSAAYAGAGGGSCMGPTNDNYNSAGGTSIYGGAGGGGNNGPYGVSDMSGPLVSQTGGTGTALGGGGGGAKVTANGTARPTSGAGARGELRIWGII